MGVLLEELPVLHQERSARAGGERVLVVGDRDAAGRGERRALRFRVVRHDGSPWLVSPRRDDFIAMPWIISNRYASVKPIITIRSEERRVGKECVSTYR